MSETEEKLLFVSPSPHIHHGITIPRLMFGVVIAMMPAFLFSVYVFGIGALIVTVLSVVSCVFFEHMIARYVLKRGSEVNDGSASLPGFSWRSTFRATFHGTCFSWEASSQSGLPR